MVKCAVVSTRKRSAGSMSVAAPALVAQSRSSATALRACARNILEKHEVRERGKVDACERPLRDRDVPFVPQADVRHLARDDALHLAVQREAALLTRRRAGLVERGIGAGIAVVAAVDPGGGRLREMEDPPQNVRVGERAAGPL